MIHVNSFVKRQTPDSEFSHFEGTWDELQELVQSQLLLKKKWRRGYRPEVILVDLPPERFMSALRILKEGDQLVGEFKARREGETPRKQIRARGPKTRAKAAYVVLYMSQILADDGSNELDPNVDDNWEIISINASPFDGEMPINPITLMHNQFGSDGGTPTDMDNDEFVWKLEESFNFWKNKELVQP